MTIKDIDRAEKYIKSQLNVFKKSYVEVGIRDGQLAKDGTDIAHYAIINEFGEGHIPERSFFRSTLDEHKKKYSDWMIDSLDDILDLTAPNAVVALSRVGHLVVNDIKDKIASNIPPENSEATKKAKRNRNKKDRNKDISTMKFSTLIDTGAMINAVNYKVGKS